MSSPDHIVIDYLTGYCPVQAEGTLNGVPFYFRARGQRWRFELRPDDASAPAWDYVEPYGDEPGAAGWIEEGEARGLIEKAARIYREACTPRPSGEVVQPGSRTTQVLS